MSNIKCEVKIERILYPKNGKANTGDWAILSCSPVNVFEGEPVINQYGNFIVKGTVPEINLLDTYTVVGKLVKDGTWGLQYDLVYMAKPAILDTEEKQKIFLSKIITENQIARLYLDLSNPFEALENEDVETLIKVDGIGIKTAHKLIQKYKDSIDFSEVYIELDALGLTKNMTDKLIETYGSPQILISKIKENPYLLIDDVDGVGWSKADEMALKSGIEECSDFRIIGFIKHFLKEEANKGNSWVTPQWLFENIIDNLGNIDQEQLRNVMYKLYENNILWWDEDKTKIGLKSYYNLENKVADELIRLLKNENKFKIDSYELKLKKMELEQGWNYTEEQLQAIKTVLVNPVSIITGSAGTGKSTVIAGVLSILDKYEFAQCALAGRAASRLTEITGEEGYTIHRLLEFNPMSGGFCFNSNCKLPIDIIILDEVSMVGADLFYKLIQAIENGSKFIMLGDEGQLESIGLCNVFKDMLESKVVPVARLTKIHRQAEKSAIITESLKVRNHQQITPQGFVGNEVRGELLDFEIDIYDDKILTQRRVIKQFERLYELHKDIKDIQVIVPIKYKGEACTHELNNIIQKIVNPFSNKKNDILVKFKKDGKEISYTLRENDKVIVNTNNYKTKNIYGKKCPVYNGNMGIIKEIDFYNDTIIINFDLWGDIVFAKKYWKTIELGYVMSGHKCLPANTLVLTNEGIKELIDLKDNYKKLKVYNGDYLEQPINFINNGHQKCKKIVTDRNYIIECTEDHGIDVLSSNGFIERKNATDIQIGDYLILNCNSNIYGNKNILDEKHNIENQKFDVRTVIYKQPKILDKNLARLLGYMVADGTLTCKKAALSKRYKEVVLDFKEKLDKLFGYNRSDITLLDSVSGKYENIYYYECHSKFISSFLNTFEGLQPHNKYIPNCILETTKELQIEFLKSFFEDGTVNLKKGKFDHFELTAKQYKIVKQLRIILLNMGVISSYKTKVRDNREYHVLYIYKKDMKVLYDLGFRFISDFKNERLGKVLAEEKRSPENKTIPYITNIINNLLNKYAIKCDSNVYLSIRTGKITRTMLKRFLDAANHIVDEQLNYLRNIHDNYYVVKVEDIENTYNETYCLTMPETHKFIQDGFYGWNCQGSQFNYVIIGLDYTSYSLLTKEWLYTAITRSQKYCVLCAENKALRYAISNSNVSTKQTFLTELLQMKNLETMD